jgi:hypothetical protein
MIFSCFDCIKKEELFSPSQFVNKGTVHPPLYWNPVDLRSRRVDSCGLSWSGETPQELATRRLSASKEEFVL